MKYTEYHHNTKHIVTEILVVMSIDLIFKYYVSQNLHISSHVQTHINARI